MQLTESQISQINDIINSGIELEEGKLGDALKAGAGIVKKVFSGKRVGGATDQAAALKRSAETIKASKARDAIRKAKVEVEKKAFELRPYSQQVASNWEKTGPARGTVNASTEYIGNLQVTENSYQTAKENLMSFISEFYIQEVESREAGIKGLSDESMPIKIKGSATSNPKDTTSGDGAFVAGTMKFPKDNMVSGDLGKGSEQDHDNINGQRAGVRTPSQMASAAMKGIFKEGSEELEEGLKGAGAGAGAGAVIGGLYYGTIGAGIGALNGVIAKKKLKAEIDDLKNRFQKETEKRKKLSLKDRIEELEDKLANVSAGKYAKKGAKIGGGIGAAVGAGAGAAAGHKMEKYGPNSFR